VQYWLRNHPCICLLHTALWMKTSWMTSGSSWQGIYKISHPSSESYYLYVTKNATFYWEKKRFKSVDPTKMSSYVVRTSPCTINWKRTELKDYLIVGTYIDKQKEETHPKGQRQKISKTEIENYFRQQQQSHTCSGTFNSNITGIDQPQ